MKNKEYFDTLRVLGILEKEKYDNSKVIYLEQSDFDIATIHKKLYLSKEFRFNYILDLLCKWANRFKSIDNFDMRLVDKIIEVARFRRCVMLYSDNSNFEKFLFQEEFIENKVDEIIRYISIFTIVDGLRTLNLNGDVVRVLSDFKFATMSITSIKDGVREIAKEVYFIIYKDKKFKFVTSFRKLKRDEYDFVITTSMNRQYIE